MRIGTHIGYKIPPLRGYKSILTLGETTLPSDITFSRGTNATLTDSNGRVAYAPHNRLTNSEDFEAAAWTKLGVQPVAANSITAPNGTVTADTVTADVSTGQHNVQQGPLSSPAGIYTFSVYLRYNNNRWLGVAIYDTVWRLAAFDIQNGVLGTAIDSGVTATITNQ